MHKDSFDFVYNAEGDYYDLVVDKKIQKVVEELKALPHDVLIRYLTYWSEAIDSRKYVVESDLPHEEWYTDCCDYAASETDEERCNNDHHIILEGLKSVKLSDDNIAEVVFVGEDKTTWVNLYTMQEFDERPVVEKMGFMDVLRVGYNYYFYKNRDMAGIPMHHRECVANDRIFQFLDLYMILRDQPNKVYYISGECRGKEQWYLILIDIANANSKTHKEIPSMWLPRRS